jgi:ankyrin repeat protein
LTEKMLAAKADVNARTARGETALHFAAREGRAALITLLLNHGADVNAVDQFGQTPAYAAWQRGHNIALQLLLARGGRR